ncbi:MAG TPA: NADH-quinone oxidoreductase subunit G [Rhodospirillaceae bacterium]|nr:NADH-quinone oxidoreductase subunit G [Rhodospirillaceae bacterium]
MIKLTINGMRVEVEEGTSVLQACEKLGIEIPRFCYHDRLTVAGNCRMCLVEVDKAPKPVASCAMPCSEGMVVHTDTPAVKQERQGVMELLLINHPLDCPVCDQGGECDLQDQAFAYGKDRCRCTEARRLVSDKDLGPLIKTVMTRCIHCTRCIRFMDEIAGSPELGGFHRGEKLEIAPLFEGPLHSELSGNLVDVCPVGALTSKPYAFRARPWELTKTESIDVMDAVGSNIRVDSRGNEVMRIVPRLHEDINEEWIGDKTRFAYDGLRLQRLDTPYLRGEDGHLHAASWDEALSTVALRVKPVAPSRIGVIAGDQVDCESMFVLGQLLDEMAVMSRDCRQDGADYDVSVRAAYMMNTPIADIKKADVILLVGVNPRHEATMVNARIYKRWRRGGLAVGMIGQAVDLGYAYDHIGYSPVVMRDLIEGKHDFAGTLKAARNPMIILGAGALARMDSCGVQAIARDLATHFGVIRDGWNGFNVLQNAAARVGGLDLGFVPQGQYGMNTRSILAAAQAGRLDVLYLLGADEIDTARLGKTFVIYQGHHGDKGASRADVILPSPAWSEKDGTYVNVEGRVQRTRRAVSPPREAREDWAILTALSQSMGRPLPYKTLEDVRDAMIAKHPHLGKLDEVSANPWVPFGCAGTLSLQAFGVTMPNYYMTDPISRASQTMAACTAAILPLVAAKEGQ